MSPVTFIDLLHRKRNYLLFFQDSNAAIKLERLKKSLQLQNISIATYNFFFVLLSAA